LEYDLLFTLIDKDHWKNYTETGFYSPPELTELGYIQCFEGKYAETIANLHYNEFDNLLLLIIDPLRIHEPIKKEKSDDVEFLNVQGKFSIDAIIDRIPVKKSKKGDFNIRIKHFD